MPGCRSQMTRWSDTTWRVRVAGKPQAKTMALGLGTDIDTGTPRGVVVCCAPSRDANNEVVDTKATQCSPAHRHISAIIHWRSQVARQAGVRITKWLTLKRLQQCSPAHRHISAIINWRSQVARQAGMRITKWLTLKRLQQCSPAHLHISAIINWRSQVARQAGMRIAK
ncbi:hypothetical protein J6590_058769 [Homalodisca vitripennis]|nr:hypothetical protein J6590_058769 [Homalodisca vitripennis]